jgi:hypothetical protein
VGEREGLTRTCTADGHQFTLTLADDDPAHADARRIDMTIMRVKTDGLNLRRRPKVESGNVITALPLAHEVDVVELTAGEDFVRVTTTVGGSSVDGFVSHRFLRDPLSQPKEALVQEAVRQWIRFGRGAGKETVDPFFRFVGQFWQELGAGFGGLDGRDVGIPWSAAFISFVVKKAGGHTGFRFAAAHARYIVDAKRKREANDETAPFWLFRFDEHRPQLGDMICLRRQPGVTFDTLPEGGFSSHCDIVVEIRDAAVRTLGGNVGNSVSLRTVPLTQSGFVKPQGALVAIMRNNT